MYILNESSIAHTFCEPTAITAYIGSLSKSYETILHPALAKYLSTIEYELSSKKYLEEKHKIKSNINNYITDSDANNKSRLKTTRIIIESVLTDFDY